MPPRHRPRLVPDAAFLCATLAASVAPHATDVKKEAIKNQKVFMDRAVLTA
jgi:hypothetical protein